MRFMILLKSNQNIEAGEMPDEAYLAEMTKFNEALADAGVLLAGEGLHPSSKAVQVAYSNGEHKVAHGPFPNPKELICGYWLWQCPSMEEAIEWVKRIPLPASAPDCEDPFAEIRQVFEADDFGGEFTPELREREERLRSRTQTRTGATKP